MLCCMNPLSLRRLRQRTLAQQGLPVHQLQQPIRVPCLWHALSVCMQVSSGVWGCRQGSQQGRL